MPSPLEAARASARALAKAGRLHDAIRLYERIRCVAPDDPTLALDLGGLLLQGDDNDRAVAHFQAMTQAHPRLEVAWQGLGKALHDGLRHEDAIVAFTRAADLAEAPGRAVYHRGMVRLGMGNFAQGWRDYEHRLTIPEFGHRVFPQPRWNGDALNGRRLLVICEQGYGDVFQFIRLLPLLRDFGGRIIFECPMELRALLAPLLDGIEVAPLRGRQAPDTRFDCYVSLLSLPLLLNLTAATIPAPSRYLAGARATPRTIGGSRRVGVCWAGKPSHPQDAHRSMDPEFLAPMARVPGVTLVSLQKDLSQRPALAGLCPFLSEPPEPLVDFAATARVIADLDLVVTVDTSVAHLAAALGCPVWLLLSRPGEWRWLRDRTDSPWYPTMQLFRQDTLGVWTVPIARVVAALRDTI